MKKIVGVVLVAVCIFALVGCGCSNSKSNDNSTNSSNSSANTSNSSADTSNTSANTSNSTSNTTNNGNGGKFVPSTVADDLKVDYGNSAIYTQQDMDSAIEVIKSEFTTWPRGCVLHSISYSSDDENNEANIKWMNELKEGKSIKENLTQCIMFKTNLHSPVNGGDGWEADKEYTDFQWWLARSDGGQWHILTYGY